MVNLQNNHKQLSLEYRRKNDLTISFFKKSKRFSAADKPMINSLVMFSPILHLTQTHLVPKARERYKNISIGSIGTVRSKRAHLIEMRVKNTLHIISAEDLISCELSSEGESILSLLSTAQAKRNFLLGVLVT